jgi:hypothetical protein
MNRRRLVELCAVVVLAGVAVAGWVRHSNSPAPVSAALGAGSTQQPMPPASPYAMNDTTQSAAMPTTSNGGYPPAAEPAQNNYYGSTADQRTYAPPPEVDTYYQDPYSSARPVMVRPAATQEYASPEPPPPQTVGQASYSTPAYHEYRRVPRGRSAGKSVALVAGSAGVGAAIGALAGGGKGAGIGALAGGGAGFIYDRLTHKTHSGF